MKKEIIITQRASVDNIGNDLEDINGNISLKIIGRNEEGTEGENLRPMNISEIELLEKRKKIDGTFGLEGELMVTKERIAVMEVDIDGSLIISDEFADHYDINDQGELIYNR